MTRRAKSLAACLALWVALAISIAAYAASPLTCPYCHNSNANIKGHCVLRATTGSCTEDYYPTHYNRASCPWCRGTGTMSHLEAFLD